MEGRILGNRYELIEKIGGGGMAIVYRAKCALLNRYVAIKILRNEFNNDEEFVKRFRIEAQAAASLSHPNIVSVYDVGHEGDLQYIVMELIDGVTLKDYIENERSINWQEAINISIQICSALEHAHKNKIVHRDIKPHNILLTKDGVAKVADFGIARAVTNSTITMVGSTIGSVHYFSPEQARGGFADEKSDLYSLGITLYEMTTGTLPFDGETPVAVALKHLQQQPTQPCEINPDIPKGVNDIIMKSIRKEQSERYQSAHMMLDDFYRVLRQPEGGFVVMTPFDGSSTRKVNQIDNQNTFYQNNQRIGNYNMDEVSGKGKYNQNYNGQGNNQNYNDRLNDGYNNRYGNNDQMPDDKKQKDLKRFAIIAAVVIVLGIIIGIYWGTRGNDSKSFTLENYKDRKYNEVLTELKTKGVPEGSILKEEDYSEATEGTIIEQDKSAGTEFKLESDKITFKVSKGPEAAKIPDIKGKTEDEARKILVELGYSPGDVDSKNEKSDVESGTVIRTEPDAGTEFTTGDTIIMYISTPEEISVPFLNGKKLSDAMKKLEDMNLSGRANPENANSESVVISTNPLGGAEVEEGSEVILNVAENTPTKTPTEKPTDTPTKKVVNGYEIFTRLPNENKFNDNDTILLTWRVINLDTDSQFMSNSANTKKSDYKNNNGYRVELNTVPVGRYKIEWTFIQGNITENRTDNRYIND